MILMILRHVTGRIRHNWPQVAITVRGDGHYGTPEVMDLLEQRGCFYVLGLPGNKALQPIAHPWCDDVATRRAQGGKHKVRRFFQTPYGAGSWSKARKVIARVEATVLGSDVRFIVTNLSGRAKHLYEKIYLRARQNGKPDQGAQALHQIRPHLLPSLAGQPVQAVLAHRSVLVAPGITGSCAKTIAVQASHF